MSVCIQICDVYCRNKFFVILTRNGIQSGFLRILNFLSKPKYGNNTFSNPQIFIIFEIDEDVRFVNQNGVTNGKTKFSALQFCIVVI